MFRGGCVRTRPARQAVVSFDVWLAAVEGVVSLVLAYHTSRSHMVHGFRQAFPSEGRICFVQGVCTHVIISGSQNSFCIDCAFFALDLV